MLLFWLKELAKYKIQTTASIYEAVEIQIEFHNKELFLTLLPSIYIDDQNKFTHLERQNIANRIFSNRRNDSVNDKENFWISLFKNGNETIQFCLDSFKIEFETNYSSAGIPVSKTHSFKGAFQTSEPKLDFHLTDKNYQMSHPLKGLKTFEPLDLLFLKTNILFNKQ